MLVGLPTWFLPESKRLLMRGVIVRQISTPLPVFCHHLSAFVDIV
jgi:hypothetical protein